MKKKEKVKSSIKALQGKLLFGRAEWCCLPGLNIAAIKAKIDTGAKTSSLHAFNIQVESRGDKDIARFDLHPVQGNDEICVNCEAEIIDERRVMSSNGQQELRYVINTPLKIGNQIWDIEVTLSNRDPLRYRMLLGRESLAGRAIIDPALNCNQGHLTKTTLCGLYS